jgi:hypothetical protein
MRFYGLVDADILFVVLWILTPCYLASRRVLQDDSQDYNVTTTGRPTDSDYITFS